MDAFQTHGAFGCFELDTPAPKAAGACCGELFGWTTEAMDIPTVGRMAALQDPQGAILGAITCKTAS